MQYSKSVTSTSSWDCTGALGADLGIKDVDRARHELGGEPHENGDTFCYVQEMSLVEDQSIPVRGAEGRGVETPGAMARPDVPNRTTWGRNQSLKSD